MSPETDHPRLRLVAPDQTGGPSPAPDPTADLTAGLIVAADVARVLGAATVMRLRADPTLREYACPFCDLPGRVRHPTDPTPADDDAAGAATVLAIGYINGPTVVRLAHPTCSPSAALRILREARPVRHRTRAACWLRQPPTSADGESGRGVARAVLLLDNQVRAFRRARAREAEECFPQALLGLGFAALTDLDDLPPAVPGLAARITPLGRGDLHEPTASGVQVATGDAVVFEGRLHVPGPWAEAARASGQVIVVAGTALTDPGPAAGQAWPGGPDLAAEALGVAARAGRAWIGQATLETGRGHGNDAPDVSRSADSEEPRTAIPRNRPGTGWTPNIQPSPNPAATTTPETTPPDSGKVTHLQADAIREAST
jgi:hypothetical protein